MSKVDLVIPDTHHKWTLAEDIIRWAKDHYDLGTIYFLGDYFDDWGDGPYQSRKTAEWLVGSTNDSQRVHLIGNHDTPYMCNTVIETLGIKDSEEIDRFAQKYLRIAGCSGWDPHKHRAINEVDGIEEAFKKLKTVVRYNEYVRISHAGLADHFNEDEFWGLVWLREEDVFTDDEFFYELRKLCGAGYSRGGEIARPGPFWLDFHADKGFYCGDFNQIVGHSQGKNVRYFKNKNNTFALCLDTRMQHFGILQAMDEESTLVTAYSWENPAKGDHITLRMKPPKVE